MSTPGRVVKVVSISQLDQGRQSPETLQWTMERLDETASLKPDIVCLPDHPKIWKTCNTSAIRSVTNICSEVALLAISSGNTSTTRKRVGPSAIVFPEKAHSFALRACIHATSN